MFWKQSWKQLRHYTSATETLTKVKQNAEEEKLRESKTCNLIIHNVPKPDNPNKEDRVKHDEDFCLKHSTKSYRWWLVEVT